MNQEMSCTSSRDSGIGQAWRASQERMRMIVGKISNKYYFCIRILYTVSKGGLPKMIRWEAT